MATTVTPTAALKEWSIVCEALRTGEQMILVRKGGVREVENRFEVAERQVWLFPNWTHQHREHIKPTWYARYEALAHPTEGEIPIQLFATIEEAIPVRTSAQALALESHHIWTQDFIAERFAWKPEEPLWILALRVYAKATPQMIAAQPAYGGCRSWIVLNVAIDADDVQPVLSDDNFSQALKTVHDCLAVASSQDRD